MLDAIAVFGPSYEVLRRPVPEVSMKRATPAFPPKPILLLVLHLAIRATYSTRYCIVSPPRLHPTVRKHGREGYLRRIGTANITEALSHAASPHRTWLQQSGHRVGRGPACFD